MLAGNVQFETPRTPDCQLVYDFNKSYRLAADFTRTDSKVSNRNVVIFDVETNFPRFQSFFHRCLSTFGQAELTWVNVAAALNPLALSFATPVVDVQSALLLASSGKENDA